MKRIFYLLLLVMPFGFAHADQIPVPWISSFTATADTLQYINASPGRPGCRFDGVDVTSPSVLGTLQIYNSSGVASGQVADIDTTKQWDWPFDIFLSSGLTYTNTGNPPAKLTFKYAKPTFR